MPAEVVPLARRNPARPQERGDRRREELLGALERLLEQRPLSAISIAEIAREAGVTRSAFYFYFANKQVAVFELLREIFVRQSTEVTAILEQDGDRRDHLAAVLGRTIQQWRHQRSLMLAALEARVTDAEASAAWEAWIGLYVGLVADFVAAERAVGAAPPGPDPRQLARVLLAANERMLELHLRADEDEAAALDLHQTLVHVWSESIYQLPLEES